MLSSSQKLQSCSQSLQLLEILISVQPLSAPFPPIGTAKTAVQKYHKNKSAGRPK